MAKSTKIIAALGVVAGLGVAAMPLASYAAGDGLNKIEDTISVEVAAVCKFMATGGATTDDGVYSKAILNGANDTVGTHSFNVYCNDADGYTVTANATGLKDGSKTIPFADAAAYATATTAKTSAWTATVTGGTGTTPVITAADTDTVILDETATTGANGKAFNVEYKVSVGDTQKDGTYSGKVTYTLAQK